MDWRRILFLCNFLPFLWLVPSAWAKTALKPTRIASESLWAQNQPTRADQDRFPQSLPSPIEQEVIPIPLDPPTPEPTRGTVQTQPFEISRIEVTGNSLFDQEINAITEPLAGKTVSLEILWEVRDKITQLYLDAGYLTSGAVLEPQALEGGVVQIRVIEGQLEGEINVEGTHRLSQDYIRSRVGLGVETPLNVNNLEIQLRLLLANPLLDTVEPTLKPGTQEGLSILTVKVSEADPFEGRLSFDNYSPPSIGSERLGANVRFQNFSGFGDVFSAAYYRTTSGGSNIVDVAYQAPLSPHEGTLQLAAQINRNEITQSPLDELGIEGNSERYEINYRQPIVRSPTEELALSLGFAFQDGQTFVFDRPTPFGIGPDEDGNSRTRVVQFGQDYVLRDPQGAWSFRSLFNVGTGLFDATRNSGSIPDGQFFSWLAQAQRAQRLNQDHLLIVRLDLQLTPDSLLPSEQFVIGGGQSVRGYQQNIRSGDNGVRFSVEDRITVVRNKTAAYLLQFAPFIDLGAVWNNSENPNPQPDQRFLAGAGLGILWQPIQDLNIRLDYGLPFIDLDDRGDNLQDDGFYFTIDYGVTF
ncbi:MAG: ShlB/FhaC/HecB family hemolysin secretion/activation protein [Leptolyngbyaceae cyanobacterium MO_188.B28]|nr:ShlB/FhaC/HecB family hemolysin secretion/activation protein [Leptolyngbyaceae cyanobacterium MO_188.B28]